MKSRLLVNEQDQITTGAKNNNGSPQKIKIWNKAIIFLKYIKSVSIEDCAKLILINHLNMQNF
jgi:hypothetical protein